jgi:hypothetical protein
MAWTKETPSARMRLRVEKVHGGRGVKREGGGEGERSVTDVKWRGGTAEEVIEGGNATREESGASRRGRKRS